MSLLDLTQPQRFTELTGKLAEVLEDIVHKIEIHTDFSIRHPDYKPLELPSEAVSRFQKMPKQMQQKYLNLQLRSFIYGIYYNGSTKNALALDGETNSLPLDLENNTFLGVDLDFYEQLHENNSGEGYFDPGWSVVKEEANGNLTVSKGGLRLYVQRDKHLKTLEKAALVGDSVAIRMPKNRVQNGFYTAVSNVGLRYVEDIKTQPLTVRTYFNLIPQGAVAVMKSLTQGLNKLVIPFSFKVLYNPKEYQRYDSGVLYFDKRDYEVVRQVLKTVYQEHRSLFQPEVPLFTKQLALGVGLAEEPDKKFAAQESFGMNRCQIVANGLLMAWHQSDNSPQARKQAIFEKFSLLGISLDRIYLNSNSEDIYQVLNTSN
ncbi:T3SS effector HopA1 family protein [Nostoc sp. UHCC 0252]|uniref:T3SS effector HopA1 family protein n=1 Tax=Nostoc sp. UHCC 0252 TaxID=3110241 RepID=UPI002B2097F4|nr:T3SS effector HopA1 family protein [Nostoc sp. UHCC 0252]MEA5603411.1 T3SS effector HopA1 family protein [Nostoc sp. UHCC 0252]